MDLSHSKAQGQDKTNKKSSNLAGTSFEETCYEFKQTDLESGPSSHSHSVVKPEKFKRNSKRNGASISNPINSSWIEQIHFKAQYNHYRTNNYASVVNSSSSLDKVGTSQAGIRQETRLVEASAAGGVATKERERHSLCWNFPRVKLPQIFNAKSLDDILGRNNVRVKIKHKNTNSTNPGPETSISNSSISSSSAPGVISPTPIPQIPQIRYKCEVTPPSPKINLSTSSSDNNFYATPGKNVFLAVPHQEVGKKHSHGKHTHVRSRSRSRVKVATTKSDNCIHRISTEDTRTDSKTPICGKTFKVPCGSNSVNDLDVLESVYILPPGSPTDDSRPHKNRQKKIAFSNKIIPIMYSPDNEMAQISENRPKLVVASVSFLQRPVSPLPSAIASKLPSPLEGEAVRVSSSNNKILSSNVFNKLTSYSSSERTMNQNAFQNNNKNSRGEDNMKSWAQVRFGESSYISQTKNDNDKANFHHLKSTQPDPERTHFMNFKCCGFSSNDQNQRGGTASAGVNRVHAQSENKAQKKCFQEYSRSRGDSSAPPGDSNNSSALDSFKNRCDEKSEQGTEQEDDQNQRNSNPHPEMGDLQSPQYVKRTAHMFNSRYAATTSHNGSGVSDENRKITPSYLNVSRSISGYSCLSYNGNSNGYHGGHGPNGTTTTGKLVPSPHRTTTTGYSNGSNFSHNGSHSQSTESDYAIKYKSTHKSNSGVRGHYDGDPDGPPPPPLPKTAPPLYSPALTIAPSGAVHSHARVIDIPIVREKSPFILNRIERLCGSSEVMSSWRRPGTKMPPQPMTAQEKIIPIVLEDNEDQNFAVKSCQGRHNLLTDNDNASVGIDDGVAGRRVELGQCVNYSKDKQKMQIPDNEDSLDGENSRAIPVHRNGNFKDWYDIGSKIDIEETGESGVLLYGKSKSMQLKTPKNLESDSSDLDVTPVAFSIKTPNEGDGEDLSMADTATARRLPLTQVLKANPAVTSLVVEHKDGPKKFSGSVKGIPSLNKENEQISAAGIEKNGDYFLLEMDKERIKLDKLVEIASEQLNALDSSSDEAGKIRAAIGKANLLCTKKFKQFKELCHTNLEQSRKGTSSSEPFTTKNDDLAGFWDMVLIQVGQIHSMFEELNPNRTRTGLEPDSTMSVPTIPRAPAVSRRSTSAKTSPTNAGTSSKLSSKAAQPKSESSALRDESRRKLLAEKRKAMKNQIDDTGTHCEPGIQIFTPSSN